MAEQTAIKRPGIIDLVIRTWSSALGALLGLLPVFAVIAAALFGLDYAYPLLEQKLSVIRPANDSIFVLMVVPGAWLFALEKLATGLAAAPMALVTMRRILVDDGPHLAMGPLLRFWLWAAAVLATSLGCLYASSLAITPEIQLVGYVLKLLAILLPLLLLPVFPAVAAGEPAANLVARMDKGLERWDGNFWRFLAVAVFTIGPAWLLLRLPAAIVTRLRGADAAQSFSTSLAGGVVEAVITVLVTVIAAATLAQWFTVARLPKPVERPLGT